MTRIKEIARRHRLAIWGAVALLVAGAALAPALVGGVRAQDTHNEGELPHEDHSAHETAVVHLSREQMELAGIEVTAAAAGTIGDAITVPGLIHPNPDQLASIASPTLATVDRVHVQVGDRVEAGQPLVSMRSPTLAEAEATARDSEAQLVLARKTLATTRELADLGEFSAREYEDSEQQLRLTEQALRRALEVQDRTSRLVAHGSVSGPERDEARSRLDAATAALRRSEQALASVEARSGIGALDAPALEAAQRAEAEAAGSVASARNELAAAQAELARTERAVRAGAVGTSQIDKAKVERDQAASRVAAARAELGRAQKELDRVELLSAQDLASGRELDVAQSTLAAAMAEFQAAEAGLAGASAEFDRVASIGQSGDYDQAALDRAHSRVVDATAASQAVEERYRSAREELSRQATLSDQRLGSTDALAEARAELRAAQAEERSARAEWERVQARSDEGLLDRAALTESDTDLESARAAYEVACQRFDREREIHDRRLRSKQQVAVAEDAAERAAISTRSARTAVEILSAGRARGSGRFDIAAPISGWVTKRLARPGQVATDAEVLLEVADITTVWAEAILYDRDLERVGVGDQILVTVPAHPDTEYRSTVESVDVLMDEETRRARARGLLPNPDLTLRPDMLAAITIQTGATSASSVVSEEAVLQEGADTYVYVEVEPGGFERRSVSLGVRGSGLVEVLSGVRAGELVVSRGAVLVKGEAEKGELAEHGHSH